MTGSQHVYEVRPRKDHRGVGNLAFHERMLQLSRETFDLGTELIQELA